MNKRVFATAIAAGVSLTAHMPVESATGQAKSGAHQLLRFYECDSNMNVTPTAFSTGYVNVPNSAVGGSGFVRAYSIADNNTNFPNGLCRQVGIYLENMTGPSGQGMKIKTLSFTFQSRRAATTCDGEFYGPEIGPFVIAEFKNPNGLGDVFTISNPMNQGIVDGVNPPQGGNAGQFQNSSPHNVVFPTASQGLFNGLDEQPQSCNNNSSPPSPNQWPAVKLGIMTTRNGAFFISNVKLNGVALQPDLANPTPSLCIFPTTNNGIGCGQGSGETYDYFNGSFSGGAGFDFSGTCGSGSCGGVAIIGGT